MFTIPATRRMKVAALARVLAGLLCLAAAAGLGALAWWAREQASIAFMMASAAFFFACGAYASIFRPSNWKRTFDAASSSVSGSRARSIIEFVKRRGLGLGIAAYTLGIAVCTLIVLFSRALLLGLSVAAGFLAVGVMLHVWWWFLVFVTRK
jgi:hypothetical protein